MSTTAQVPAVHGARPTQPAPDPTVPVLRGGTYRLGDRRPRLADLLDGIDYWTTHDYPARGEDWMSEASPAAGRNAHPHTMRGTR
jgi:hypothetical protein